MTGPRDIAELREALPQFEVEEEIADGLFRNATERSVALRMLSAQAQSPLGERFEHELAALVEHRHIAPMYGVDFRGRHILVERAFGGTLADAPAPPLRRNKPWLG